MTRITPRERRLLIITGSMAVLVFVQFFLLRPAVTNIRRLRTKVKISANDLGRIQAVERRRSDVAAAYEKIRNRITSTKTPMREIQDLLLMVEETAKSADVEILQNIHVKDEPMEYFNKHTLRFRGRGKTPALMRMIYDLQAPNLLLKVPEMKFVMKDYLVEMELEITRVVCAAGQNDER
jgi:hypothetical protein